MKVTQKDDNSIEIKPMIESEETVDNKLQLLKYSAEVQSRIREDISSDFILAKLGSQDKEGIIETTSNAYFFKRLVKIVELKGKKWTWDETTKTWERSPLDEKQKAILDEIAKNTFDSYMTRVFMTVILNRNVEKNHIMKLLGQYDDIEDEEHKITTETNKNIDKVKEEIITQLAPNKA